MRYRSTMMTVALLTSLMATAPLPAGASMDSVKDKAKSVAQDAKTVVSDAWITSKAKIALFADERVKGRQVDVDTQSGVVYLRGKVDSAQAKTTADEIARNIEGVQSVKNDLQVVPPAVRKSVKASDHEIKRAVENRLSRNTQLKDVDVRSDAGVVTLTGEVPSIGVSAKASEMARSVPGVRSVKNELAFNK
jgi:hyperosmotically inducible protein